MLVVGAYAPAWCRLRPWPLLESAPLHWGHSRLFAVAEQDAPSRVTGISFSLSIFTNIVVLAGKRLVVATHLRARVVNPAEVGVAVGVFAHEWTTAYFVDGSGSGIARWS